MPVCPKCGAEYRAGFTRCSDCDVELVERIAKRKTDKRDSDTDLGLMFPILWAGTTTLAFRLASVYGTLASLGRGAMIFYILTYAGGLSGILQSPLIFWSTRRKGGSLHACAVRATLWIILTTVAWAIAGPVGFATGLAAFGILGVVIGPLLIGAVVGLFQSPVLWRSLRRRALWWIPISALAFLAAGGGAALWDAFSNNSASASPEAGIMRITTALGPIFGAVTGLSLWWLLRTKNRGQTGR